MVKYGQRILEGVDVSITKIEQLLTPNPTVSDRDSPDVGQKIRYLIDQVDAILAKADVLLSTRASEATLSNVKAKTDNLDVALSTRASETTLSGIRSQTDKLTFDTSNRLAIQNPPNLDVALSSRASEATLSAIKGALASVATDKLRASVVDALPESPFNITKVSGTAQTARDWSGDFAKLQNFDVALSSRASESTLSALNSKVQSQSASLFAKDVSVGTTATQVDADTAYRDEVILLADPANTDKVYVGTSSAQPFPLAAGASVAIRKTALNLIYVKAASGTQTVHVISGGA